MFNRPAIGTHLVPTFAGTIDMTIPLSIVKGLVCKVGLYNAQGQCRLPWIPSAAGRLW